MKGRKKNEQTTQGQIDTTQLVMDKQNHPGKTDPQQTNRNEQVMAAK